MSSLTLQWEAEEKARKAKAAKKTTTTTES